MKKKAISHHTIKNYNRKRILSILWQRHEMTKQEIAQFTGISFPTVTSNVKTLTKEGLLKEGGVSTSTGGRRPQLVHFQPNSRYSFGVELQLNKIRIVLINLVGEIKEDIILPQISFSDAKNAVASIASQTSGLLKKHGLSPARILGIGFSLPGTVNDRRKLLELAPNLHVKDLDFSSFQSYFDFPLFIENEANASALAELHFNPSENFHNMAFISITYGVGVGLIFNHKLYRGKNKRAGEFGHMTIIKDGKLCACGRAGCWELYASERVLLEAYQKETMKPTSSLADFFSLLNSGQTQIQRSWQNYLDYLALGIQNIILGLDPHCIILGGEISLYLEPWLDELKEKIFVKNSFYQAKDVKVLISRLGRNASILGAAYLPILNRLFT